MDASPPQGSNADLSGMIVVGVFARIAEARETALNLAALGIPYGIERDGSNWVLKVEVACLEEAQRELSKIAREQEENDRSTGDGSSCEAAVLGAGDESQLDWSKRWSSLSTVALVFVGFGILQAEGGSGWREAGILIPEEIWKGQWWRLITALTLHGDLLHWFSNLLCGICFGGLLMPRFGCARTWGLILGSGILGNAMNAALYASGGHRSMGASTAVFGALGLMTGERLREVLSGHRRRWWDWVLPPGAGLCLLATLGTGGQQPERVDVLAHLFGFLAGALLGFGWPKARGFDAGVYGSQTRWAVACFVILATAWGMARLRGMG